MTAAANPRRSSTVPANGVAVIDLQLPATTTEALTLQIDAPKRRCTAPIALERRGDIPTLTCVKRG